MNDRRTVAIDILSDSVFAGQAPVSFIDHDDPRQDLDRADERFLELLVPAYQDAAGRVGVHLVVTQDAAEIDRVQKAWPEDGDDYGSVWQAVHETVAVDVEALARRAVRETME